ncbi:hypothetical protein D3C71_262890 [compost metagenome]
MHRILLFSCCILTGLQQVSAQNTYKIDQFSDQYYAKVFIKDTAEVFSPGWIAVYNQQDKELLKVESEELALELHEGKVVANIRELPYGEQSVVQYLDVNFDGIKDLAIEDGQNSCYHGPSFQVYLGHKGGFTHSPSFTRLAQEYCGLFEVNEAEKRLYTMTKSGCCWHQFSSFEVVNNTPEEREVVEEDFSGGRYPFGTLTRRHWDGKKMVTTVTEIVSIDEVTIRFAFTVEKNDKLLTLFLQDDMLYYALQDKEERVELSYPESASTADFIYNAKDNTLQFKNKGATYTIYEQGDQYGIRILTGGKTYNWTGRTDTRKGRLKRIAEELPGNVKLVR